LTSTHGISLQSERHPVQFGTAELLNLKGCMVPEAGNFKPDDVEAEPEAGEH
jgi:hypothetical protein